MKLEIEITEDEIRNALERKVRTAIADQTNKWGTDIYIQNSVKKQWQAAVDEMIGEILQNSSELRTKIIEQVERKLRAQVTAAMKIKEEK